MHTKTLQELERLHAYSAKSLASTCMSKAERLMVELGHPFSAHFQEVAEYFDGLRYETGTLQRRVSYLFEDERVECNAPSLQLLPKAGSPLPSWWSARPDSPQALDGIRTCAENGWAGVVPAISYGSFVVTTANSLLRSELEAIRRGYQPLPADDLEPERDMLIGMSVILALSPPGIDEWRAIRDAVELHAGAGAIARLTPVERGVPLAAVPLSHKLMMEGAVDRVTETDALVLVPAIAREDEAAIDTITGALTEFVRRGLPFSQVEPWLMRMLPQSRVSALRFELRGG